MARTVVHVSHGEGGGAGRAARRAHLAARAAGWLSAFAFCDGARRDPADILLRATPPADPAAAALHKALAEQLQWAEVHAGRTALSNTLLSIPYPGVAADQHPLIASADILHLHWPSWAITPATLHRWLQAGRRVVWTLHDLWAMTGGCHYPAGCEQYRTHCLKCPQLEDSWSVVPNSFAEKRAAWSDPRLAVVAPSRWIAECARGSAILGACRIEHIPNPIDTDDFAPREDRDELRAGYGIAPDDLVLLLGSADNREKRKGAALLAAALRLVIEDGRLPALLPPGARIALFTLGRAAPEPISGVQSLAFGTVEDDAVLADILAAADAACIASLEDNYPNVALEALACGTPCIAYAAGGVPDLVRDGESGVLVAPVGDVAALAEGLLRFAARHRGPAMRTVARAQILAENALPAIGARLAALYAGMAGDTAPRRALTPILHERLAKSLANAGVAPDLAAGPDFLRFPLNRLLRRWTGSNAIAAAPLGPHATPAVPLGQQATTRLLAVATRHSHHAAASGPLHFLRHLPHDIAVTTMQVPLGAELAGAGAPPTRDWARLAGFQPFGEQPNAWQAETELLATCAAEPIDLLHYIDGELGGWLLPSAPAALFHQGRKPRLIATFHQPPALLARMINRSALRALDAVIVLCESQRRLLAPLVAPDRLHLIPHGVDTRFFHPAPLRTPDGTLRLLAVGHWLRDYPTALRALARLRAGGTEARLTIVSHNLSGLPRAPSVELASGLSDEALREAYHQADALFLPLTDATANNAILEAMACGRPVVTTDTGGVRETTGDAALLCPPGDDTALAAAALALPTHAPRLATTARQRAETLDWHHIGHQHAALYARLLAARSAAA